MLDSVFAQSFRDSSLFTMSTQDTLGREVEQRAFVEKCARAFSLNPYNYCQSHTTQQYWASDECVCQAASSGAVLELGRNRYVISALHAIDSEMGMYAQNLKTHEIGLIPIKSYPIFLKSRPNCDKDRGDPVVDFTFFELPQDIIPIRRYQITETKDIHYVNIIPIPFIPILSLDRRDEFFCCGSLLIKGDEFNRSEFHFVRGLHINEEDTPYLYFDVSKEMDMERPDLSGMSGAPIFDSNGIPVALVCGGCCEDKSGRPSPLRIWGISLNEVVRLISQTQASAMPKFNTLSPEIKPLIQQQLQESSLYDYCK